MTTSEPERTYGHSTAWKPEAPRLRLFPLLVSLVATGVALMVASGILPGVHIDNFWGALLVAVIVSALNAVIPPVLAALRLPLTLVTGFLLVLIADALILLATDALTDGILRVDNFGWALLASLVVAAVSVVLAVILGSDDMSSIRVAHRIARRQGIIAATDVPGDHLSRDRRAGVAGVASGDAGWERPEHGALGAGDASARGVGDGSLVADGGEPGGDPVGLERGHLGVQVGGEGDGEADDLLGATGLRRDRAAARHGHRSARRRWRQPWQPSLRRGAGRDPHRQPDGGGEEVEPRLPRVLRQRRQRHAHAGAVRVGGRPRVDGGAACDPSRRATAWPPRRHLPADAGRALRLRARPDRLRCPHRHHARPPRRVRDLLQLRRGRAPLWPRTRGHAGGAAQARRQVRPHRDGPAVCAAALRDRRPLRPRPDPGRDLQATQRLRARRARRALTRPRRRPEHRRR